MGGMFLRADGESALTAPLVADKRTTVPVETMSKRYKPFVYDANWTPEFDGRGMMLGLTQRTGAAQDNRSADHMRLFGLDKVRPLYKSPYLRYRANDRADEARNWGNMETYAKWRRVAARS